MAAGPSRIPQAPARSARVVTAPAAGWPGPAAGTRLLVVAPHPDDETIAAGELIQQARAAGGAVRVLLLTDGDDNPWPQRWIERRIRIGAAERQRWGRRRRAELHEALDLLGVPAADLRALGWPDMGLTALLRRPPAQWRTPLLRELDDFRPDTVVVPALADRHPDHGAAHVLLRLALAAWDGPPPALLDYLVHGREAADAGRAIELPCVQAFRRTKLLALERHRSQLALSAGRVRRLAGRAERFGAVAPGGGAAALPWRPAAPLRPWLRLTVADADGARTWRWPQAPLRRDGAGWRLAAAAGQGPRFAKLHLDLPSPWIFDHWGWREL
ncbi:PIG-L deacetylase family protein [Fulvimonas soli]|jgi:LmbE family N-acetylglucosaminyl deacetylase|uniref:LmbE family N-acetylglucosaminyl deacetylase n=1 Tax=Fulvimonas soli TaxID=155197 RepID=A0A316IBR6_9GAMM|nr:PIG-L family deacetylase [Fulvimonas soli]PWK89952.1 LmbE family N-acetylglucosaminyl deacetylase [Fulvimonas soli]TNY25395.1 hypothetical protein BV497_14245 [Fulvimonas soli]